jgi:hypothetical protein
MSDLLRLQQSLDATGQKLAETRETMIRFISAADSMRTAQAELCRQRGEQIAALERAILGNGRMGLCQRMDAVESAIQARGPGGAQSRGREGPRRRLDDEMHFGPFTLTGHEAVQLAFRVVMILGIISILAISVLIYNGKIVVDPIKFQESIVVDTGEHT